MFSGPFVTDGTLIISIEVPAMKNSQTTKPSQSFSVETFFGIDDTELVDNSIGNSYLVTAQPGVIVFGTISITPLVKTLGVITAYTIRFKNTNTLV